MLSRGTPRKRGQGAQARGCSRSGFSTKVHVSVDALGNPLRLRLTPGQAHEAPQVEALLKEQQAEFVLADKGYDAEHVRATIRDLGAEPVIPPRAKRLNPSDYDVERYNVTLSSASSASLNITAAFSPASTSSPVTTSASSTLPRPSSGYAETSTEPSLRYDTTGRQFIFNWQTPKQAGACYRITVETQDGSKIYSDFQLR